MSCVLALDQGTTSSRAILFDNAGAIVAMAQREIRQIFPRPGWVEHDPNEIWESQIGVAREAITRAGCSVRDIVAIGITNQRETTVVWDRNTGIPVCNAIVWQDRRTAPVCDELRSRGLEALFSAKTGLVLDAYFSATKLAWILDNVAGARALADAGRLAFGTIDSWLVWKLSGGTVHVTDASNASRTLLFNIHEGDWDEELLELFRIPRAVLPMVVPSSGVIAETAGALFSARIPVAGLAGDQQAALFGQRCTKPGMVKNTYGTGCFMLMHTGKSPACTQHKLLATTAWRKGGRDEYALEGSVFVAGAVVQWLRDGLGIIKSSAEVTALATSVPDNGGVYFVPAFAGLGSPHWDPYARGTIVGITGGTNAGHIARAALESIAYQVTDVLCAMVSDASVRLSELRVDGGAAQNDFLLQFQADVLGVRVVRPRIAETTALGAAYLAGLGVGFWQDEAVIDRQWQIERSFDSTMSREQAEQRVTQWRKAVERSRNWARRE